MCGSIIRDQGEQRSSSLDTEDTFRCVFSTALDVVMTLFLLQVCLIDKELRPVN